MTTSLATVFGRMFHGLSKLCLSDHVVVRLLGLTTLGAILAALAMLALDPPGDLTVFRLQTLSEVAKQQEIFRQWGSLGLEPRVQAYFLVDALALAPMLLFGLLALGLRLTHLYRLDHPGKPGRLAKTAGWLFAALVMIAFALAEAGDFAFLWGGGGTAWLEAGHRLFMLRMAACAAIAISAALAFSAWYFRVGRDDSDNAARDRARLRSGVADILWRTKYAVAVVAAFGTLAIGMDQTRDALVRQSTDAAASVKMTPTTLGYAITALSILALAYASWLWPRKIVRLKTPGRDLEPTAQELAVAKWWCRILGLLPFLFVGVVLSQTIGEQPARSPALPGLVRFALANAALALVFLISLVYRNRDKDETRYYLGSDDSNSARIEMAIRSVIVACGGPLVFLAARFASLVGTPPLALAVIASGLATWAAVLGWVAYQSRRNGIPYLLVVLVIVALLGIFGYAEVHSIRGDMGAAGGSAFAARSHFISTVLLAIPCLWLAWWLTSREPTSGNVAFALGAVAVPIVLVLVLHDRAPVPGPPNKGPSLEDATVDWLNRLPRSSPDKSTPYPVYVISAEGGGIRSAYWTATVLAHLKALDPEFDRRTLSIAAVSGGALGVAAFRACELGAMLQSDPLQVCIRKFGATDFWTQLLGGALFEDALASVVPTSLFCKSPGCGVLGRSYWFEGTMEETLPAMASGLAASTRQGRFPHLFLTTTRVETGERWIQSDVEIRFEEFPGACDVLKMVNSDIRLSTAAHNSSRFPYTNPVGALFALPCDRAQGTDFALRARLQDGGYFDDSATSTSSDVLRMLRRCLQGLCKGIDDPASLQRLRPVVITIRNEDRFDVRQTCAQRNPARPQDRPPLRLLPSILSSGDTLLQTRVAHMHASEAQLEAEAESLRLERQRAAASTPAQGASSAPPSPAASSAAASGGPCLPFREWTEEQSSHRFDLLVDASLYPSGWMLSRAAMDGIDAQAERYVGKLP